MSKPIGQVRQIVKVLPIVMANMFSISGDGNGTSVSKEFAYSDSLTRPFYASIG